MQLAFLFLAGVTGGLSDPSPPVGGTNPTLSGGTVASTNSGSCTNNEIFGGDLVSAATLRVSWAVVNADNAHFQINVLENGVDVSGPLPSDTTTWDKTIQGSVEVLFGNTGFNAFDASWTYDIHVSRIVDGVVVSAVTTPLWAKRYGTCSP